METMQEIKSRIKKAIDESETEALRQAIYSKDERIKEITLDLIFDVIDTHAHIKSFFKD